MMSVSADAERTYACLLAKNINTEDGARKNVMLVGKVMSYEFFSYKLMVELNDAIGEA
jgi:hypothetical protein